LNADISAIIKETLTKPRDADRLLKEVADMRLRIDGERHTDFIWDIKDIRGGLVDIEFIAQYLQLLHADAHPEILSTNTGEALTNLKDSGVLSEVHEKTLKSALELWQAMQGMLQLTIGGYFKPERQSEIPEALKHALAKSGGCKIFQTLEEHMKEVAAKVYRIFQEIIEEPAAGLNPEE
jgi:glutamate-ammonia-ligase adenylyltransferase